MDIDVESLSSFTDEDDSSQSDSDFFIVPFPDCFDTKKPLITSVYSDDGGFATDDNHNDIPAGTFKRVKERTCLFNIQNI